MTKSHLGAPHVATLLEQGALSALRGEDAGRFARAAEAYPWRGGGLDWQRLRPHLVVTPGPSMGALAARLSAVAELLTLVYSHEEAIYGPPAALLEHLDTLIWRAPGRRALVGARRAGRQLEPVPGVIAEYDGADRLRVSLGRESK